MPRRRKEAPPLPAGGVREDLPLVPPSGMHDLLPAQTAVRRRVAASLVDSFERWGYELVTTPAFEHAEVLERGLDAVDRRDLLRFVEPETGEVALLRPDITPQIARIVATRLGDRPPPWRLAYEGTVVRRRRGRSRRPQQIAQAGIECIGVRGPDADAEVAEAAVRACGAAGLAEVRLELRQVRIGREALAAVPDAMRPALAHALDHKDRSALETGLRGTGVRASDRRRLLALAELYGEAQGVIALARRTLGVGPARAALDELTEVATRLQAAGLGDRLHVDLGEVRGQAYYTGVSFALLAEGPGEPLGSGGRYDRLLERFGRPAPATGVAIDLGHLEWALERTGRTVPAAGPIRVVLATGSAAAEALGRGLRSRGLAVARLGAARRTAALAFARAWGYDAAVFREDRRLKAWRAADGATRRVETGDDEALAAWLRGTGTH